MTEQPGLPLSCPLPVPPIAELGRITWDEVPIYADLVALFFEREGRDPQGVEFTYILIVLRMMRYAGVRWLH